MPIFPYMCAQCGHETEDLFIRLADAPKHKVCPECGWNMVRTIGRPSFVIQGQQAPVDTWKEAWEGTPLADGCELNDKYQFKRKGIKPFTDLGGR